MNDKAATKGGQFRPSILKRVLAFIADMLIGGALYGLLYHITIVVTVRSILEGAISYNGILITYLLTFFWKLLTTLLLGVSLGEFLMGLKSEGDFSHVRLAGAFRVMFGFFTAPLIIFDIPLFFDRMTFKELFSGAVLVMRREGPVPIFAIPTLALFLPLYLYSPFFQDPLNLNREFKINMAGEPIKIPLSKDDFYTERFGLSIKPNVLDDFHILPNFSIIKDGRKLRVLPSIIFFDKESGATVSMSAHDGTILFNDKNLESIKRALLVNIRDFHKNILNGDIFIFNDLSFREKILKEYGVPVGNLFELLPLGDTLFLTATQLEAPFYRVQFISVPPKLKKFEITYDGATGASYSKLISKVLLNASFDKREDFTINKKFNPLRAIDLYFEGAAPPEEQERFLSDLYDFYFDLSKEAVTANNEPLIDLIVQNIERLISVAKIVQKRDPKIFNERYFNIMVGLKRVVQKREASFFRMNQ